MKIKKTLFAIFSLFFIIILFYTFYRSEIYHDGTIRKFYFKYYFLSALFFILAVWVKNIKNSKIVQYIFFSTIFFISFVYILQITIILKNAIDTNNKKEFRVNYSKKNNFDYDIRNKFHILSDLKLKNIDAVVAIDPYHHLKDNNNLFPLSSFSNKLTIHCNEYGRSVSYQSDRYGFSNPDEEWDNQTDFLILGDRFAHGDCLPQEKTIAGNLRKLNGGYGVLNLGFGGNGPLIEFAVLKEYLDKSKAKTVLWFYCETNDLVGPGEWIKNEGLKAELKNNILSNYIDDPYFSQNLIEKQEKINELNQKKLKAFVKNFEKQKKQNLIFDIIKLKNIRYYLSNFSELNKQQNRQSINDEFKKIILLTEEYLDKKNVDFYFIYFTDIHRYTKNNFDKNRHDYQKVIDFINSQKNINLIDLHSEIFLNLEDPLSLFIKQYNNEYLHYNELGSYIISNKIFKKIKKNNNQI